MRYGVYHTSRLLIAWSETIVSTNTINIEEFTKWKDPHVR